jgi:hypothetical protein
VDIDAATGAMLSAHLSSDVVRHALVYFEFLERKEN